MTDSTEQSQTASGLRFANRREVLEDFQRLLAEVEKDSGEVLFQGDWLQPDEARRRFRRQFPLRLLRFLELTALLLLLLALTIFPILFLGVLGGITA